MKSLFTLAIILGACSVNIAQWTENFDDGDFTNNLSWKGNTTEFIVDAGTLRLNAPAVTGASYLAVASTISTDATWAFSLKLNFNPSSSNYAKVYLIADNADLNQVENGYFVKIGGTSDKISLYKVSGGKEMAIINGADKRVGLSVVEVSLQITRNINHTWEVKSKILGENNYSSEGVAIDKEIIKSAFFGVYCKYTSTRSTKFFFDNFVVTGSKYVDLIPPKIKGYETPKNTQIKLIFNEAIETTEAKKTSHFLLKNELNPSKVIALDANTLLLEFNKKLAIINTLAIMGIPDLAGNKLDTTLQIVFVSQEAYHPKDLIINELFPDPSPPKKLPAFEFVELFNNSDRIINLENWKFGDGSKTAVFPKKLLFPDSFLIICSKEAEVQYKLLGTTLGVDNWPTLNNSADALSLFDNNNLLIDEVNYTSDWYKNTEKKDGGWTLELKNPASKCTGVFSWSASVSTTGGTPGKPNSIKITNSDNKPPLITQALLTNSVVDLSFSEPLAPSSYKINWQPISKPNKINVDVPSKHLTIKVDNPSVLAITIEVEDCQGNKESTSSALLPIVEPQANNIVINEVLFDPFSEGEDFVELLNTTDFNFNMKGFYLSNGSSSKEISDIDLVLKAHHYLALSKNILFLKNHYLAPDSSLVKTDLPTMPNEKGVLLLKSNSNKLLDSIYYSEKFHFSLIANTEGISLERISPYKAGLDNHNWRSAPELAKFATPGYKNAQSGAEIYQGEITVLPQVITPNNDGQSDYCQITYSLQSESQTISISIYSINGQLVKKIAANSLIAAKGFFIWDGTNAQGRVLPTAHYIIVSKVISSGGKILTYKNKVVVANNF